jgi:hypothetical protein
MGQQMNETCSIYELELHSAVTNKVMHAWSADLHKTNVIFTNRLTVIYKDKTPMFSNYHLNGLVNESNL